MIFLLGYILVSIAVLLVINIMLGKRNFVERDTENLPATMLNEPIYLEPSSISNMSGPVQAPLVPPHTDLKIAAQNGSSELTKNEIAKMILVMMVGAFVAILNQTIDNVAIPHMMLDFNVSASTIQWIETLYMLVNGILIPVSAFLMERFGARSLVFVAMSFFSLGSLLGGVSPTFSILLIGRGIQAIGAGILLPLMTNVFLTVFPPEARGKAMGTMGISMILAPAIGPTVGGWVVQTYTWRLLFYSMVPIGIIDLLLAAKWMKNVLKLSYPDFDLWGAVLSTIGFGSLLYGISEAGNQGWGSLTVVSTLLIGSLAILIFIRRELITEKPLLEFRVFKYNIFTLTMVISAVVNMALYAGMLLLPIYLQNIRSFTPLQSGLLLLPGALIMGIMGPVAGAIFDRIGARLLSIVGLIITTIATWEFSRLTAETTYSHIITIYIFRSFGMSFLMMPLMAAGMNQLPSRLNSHGTAMRNTIRQLAGSFGTAVLVSIMSTRTTIHLEDYSNTITMNNPLIMNQLHSLMQGLSIPVQAGQTLALQELYGVVSTQSAIDGLNDSFLVAAGITVVALILAFFIKKVYPEES
jgi:EmrB/QacA subfamily drug resistance transporter